MTRDEMVALQVAYAEKVKAFERGDIEQAEYDAAKAEYDQARIAWNQEREEAEP